MANQIEILRTKVKESKTDFEVLKQTKKEFLEKDKIQEKLNKIQDVKKELEALKINTLISSSPESQKEISDMEQEISTLEKDFLAQFDLQLNDLKKEVDKSQENKDIPNTEEKGRLKRQWEGVTSKEEWHEHTLTNVGRVAMGVGAAALVYKGVKRLFGIGKEKEEDKKENSEGESKGGFRKKALLRGGGIFGGLAVWKNRDTISDWFSDLFGKKKPENPDNPDLPSSFDDLPEDKKVEYRATSDSIDEFSTKNIDLNTVVSFSKDEKENKEKKSIIIHGLDHESENLQNFYSNSTLDYISDQTNDGIIDNILNRGKTKLHNVIGPFLLSIESFKPLGAEFISNPAEALNKWLKGAAPEERKKTLSLFYREYINVINYSVEKKKLIEEKLAKEEVMTKARIGETPNEKEQDLIDDLLDNDKRKKGKLESFFKNHTLADLPKLTKEYNIESAEVSKDTQELLNSLQEEKDNIIQKDDTGETIFSRAETDFADGNLQEDTRDDLDKTCKGLDDAEFGKDNKSFFTAYTHLIIEVFSGNTELANSFMEKSGIKEVTVEFKSTLEGYRAKLKAGTFSKEDLQKFKNQTEVYLNAKKQYEITMNTIDSMSSGLHFDLGKLISLPFNAFKDVAKAYGEGKTNSRRERIGYGLGGCYVAGQTLYIGANLIPGQTIGAIARPIVGLTGKLGIKIGKLPITIVEQGLKMITGRTHLTSLGWSKYLKGAAHLEEAEKITLLKYALLKGEISESRAVSVAKKLNINSLNGDTLNIDNLLNRLGFKDQNQIDIFRKYKDNKSIRSLLIKEGPNLDLKTRDKLKYSIKDRALKIKIEINSNNFSKLQVIEENIQKFGVGTKEKSFRETFMKNTKTLDKIDDLMKNKKLMGLITEIGNTSDDYIRLSKILANNFHNFSSLDELENYMLFLKNNKSAITNTNTFMRNSIGKRGKIKSMNTIDQAKYIETAKLNTSFLDRRINGMKENFKKSAETLKKLIKRSPYPEQVAETARNLENMANTENEVYRAAQMAEEVGEGTWLSGKTGLMNQISPLLKEKAFLESLGKAKTPQAIKELFASKGINTIPEELAESLAKTKNTRKIVDTIDYVKNYDKLNSLMRILENPNMRYAGRIANRVLLVGTVVLGGFLAYQTYQEGAEIMKTNNERGELKQQESLYDLGLTLAGACAFIPGIGWIAGGTIFAVTTIGSMVKESVFDTLDKYNKNYKDFLQDSPLLIKQHILTTVLGQNKTDAAMGEYLARRFSSKDFKYLTEKTGSEAMKALLYVEEWKNSPLAMFDITKEEDKQYLASLNPPKTAEDVGKATVEVDARVNKRYEYLKQKLGTIKGKDSKVIWIPIPGTLGVLPKKIEYEDGKDYLDVQKLLTNDIVSKGKGMEIINQLLLESSYASDNPELFGSIEKVEAQKKTLKEKLDLDASLYTELEKLYSEDQKSLLYMYRYANDYKNHIESFGAKDDKYEQIQKNIDYFSDYMNYKLLETGLDATKYSQGFAEVDFILCRDFFINFESKSKLSNKEIYGETPKLQNILYRIATEVIGVQLNNNSMQELQKVFTEANEKTYGIYFEDGDSKKLNINGDVIDSVYNSSDDTIIQKIKQDIQKQIKDNDLIDIGTGDEILNKEIGSRYIKIIDEELSRK